MRQLGGRAAGPVDPAKWMGPDPTAFAIADGHLVNTVQKNPLLWNEEFDASQEVYAKLSRFDDNVYDMSLVLKAHATGNAICDSFRVEYSISNGPGLIVSYCQDTTTTLIDYAFGGTGIIRPGDELGARVYAGGCVVVFVNRQPVLLTSTGGFQFADGRGWIGVYSQFSKDGPGVSSEWDDFGGGSLL